MAPARLVFWAGIAAVVALSLWPRFVVGSGDSITDKLDHALAYAALAVAGAFAFFGPRARRNLALGLLLLGAGLELAQIAVPGRSTSLADMVANAIGVAVGLGLAMLAHAWLGKRFAALANPAGSGPNRGSDRA